MKIKGLVDEDVVNYKKTSMYVIFPKCRYFKCGAANCQNSALAREPAMEVSVRDLVKRYTENPITEAVVCGGLEPFDSWPDLALFISKLRSVTDDDIVIYSGYTEDEIGIYSDFLKEYGNIIVKYGRYVPGQTPHHDELLGVDLASDNQYAKRI